MIYTYKNCLCGKTPVVKHYLRNNLPYAEIKCRCGNHASEYSQKSEKDAVIRVITRWNDTIKRRRKANNV